MKTRAFFMLAVSVDLDLVPGHLHQPEDWPAVFRDRLTYGISYGPDVSVSFEGIAPYRDAGDSYVRPLEPTGLATRRREAVTASAIIEANRIREAENRAAIRRMEHLVREERFTQEHLAGPLLRESLKAVEMLEQTIELLSDRMKRM